MKISLPRALLVCALASGVAAAPVGTLICNCNNPNEPQYSKASYAGPWCKANGGRDIYRIWDGMVGMRHMCAGLDSAEPYTDTACAEEYGKEYRAFCGYYKWPVDPIYILPPGCPVWGLPGNACPFR